MPSCSPSAVRHTVAALFCDIHQLIAGILAGLPQARTDVWITEQPYPSRDEVRLHPLGECYCKRNEQDCKASLWFQLNCCSYISHSVTTLSIIVFFFFCLFFFFAQGTKIWMESINNMNIINISLYLFKFTYNITIEMCAHLKHNIT